MNEELTIAMGADRRLSISPWENAAGQMLVTVAPQYKDRAGQWRLAHSGLMLAPDVARELAPVLVIAAEAIETSEPIPTEPAAALVEGSPS